MGGGCVWWWDELVSCGTWLGLSECWAVVECD